MFPAGSSACTRPAFGDVDGDGDLELPGFRNLQRQLHNELSPRVGRHGRLVLHAQSSSSAPAIAVLMLSPVRAAAPISFGVIGTLELDAQTLFVHSFQQVAGTGQPTTVSYLVPNQPGLLGLSLWAQGIFHDGGPTSHWRLGNLVKLSIQL